MVAALNETLAADGAGGLEDPIGSRRAGVRRRSERRPARVDLRGGSEGACAEPGDHLAADAIMRLSYTDARR